MWNDYPAFPKLPVITGFSALTPLKSQVLLHSALPCWSNAREPVAGSRLVAQPSLSCPAISFCSLVGGLTKKKGSTGQRRPRKRGSVRCPLSRQEVPLSLISIILFNWVARPPQAPAPRQSTPSRCGRVPLPQHSADFGLTSRRKKESSPPSHFSLSARLS